MSEENKRICKTLADVLNTLPDDVQEKLQRDWTSEAIGAKKAHDIMCQAISGGTE